MSRSKSPYVCETCGLPVRVRYRKGVPHWTHMANAATVDQVCGQAVALRRGTPASARTLEPGATLVIWRPAGMITIGGTAYPQRFRPGMFDGLLDKVEPVRRGGEEVGSGRWVAAEVAADGTGVTLTMEILTPIPGRVAA